MRYKHVKAGKAERYYLDQGEMTSILASGADTDDRVSIFDSKLPKGNEAPWHYHEIDDEIFYLISGEIEFGVENEEFVASAGDLVIAGPNVKRRFRAITDSHLLVINAPSGPSEGFIRDISTFSQDNQPTDSDRQAFIDKYRIHIV
ncbi:cupin domain-containing protein [Shewanella sp. Choline-02u-19]|uniref:cupin domain-containing protein n=1 Tax=unclassified Shewanella TaxID=196818 RepID=UPI000C31DBB1|nr:MULTISPECIES: cupin domain-containing protein [unclassified Shewanella]PKG57106.1 cupin domain-containing protein [Shewanella sp. GutDb-MelDb]PKH57372.1 cupin domain-containing protein [Shewanella sp. Bg11-22]PKI28327.1 cupin domain-containing protein [Shewanella sp. Choline-02u-19]